MTCHPCPLPSHNSTETLLGKSSGSPGTSKTWMILDTGAVPLRLQRGPGHGKADRTLVQSVHKAPSSILGTKQARWYLSIIPALGQEDQKLKDPQLCSKFEAGLGYLRLWLKYVYGGGGSGECQQLGSPSHTFRRFCSPKARSCPLDSLHTSSIWVAQLSASGEKNLEEDMCTWLMVSEVP